MTKLVLGTAQFGMYYGLTNKEGMPGDTQLSDIFSLANQLGIRELDTALSYGEAHKRIGQLSRGQFDIVTKIPQGMCANDIEDCILESLKETQAKKFRCVMFHSQEDILAYDFDLKLQQLVKLQTQGKTDSIGVSVYDLAIVYPLLMDPNIRMIQVPLNVLDNRSAKLISQLKVARPDMSIYVRSSFLQGALLSNPTALPAHLLELQTQVDWFLNLCEDENVNPGVAALNFVMQSPVDGIVIGITSSKELRQVHSWFHLAQQIQFDIPNRPFHEQFDPRTW